MKRAARLLRDTITILERLNRSGAPFEPCAGDIARAVEPHAEFLKRGVPTVDSIITACSAVQHRNHFVLEIMEHVKRGRRCFYNFPPNNSGKDSPGIEGARTLIHLAQLASAAGGSFCNGLINLFAISAWPRLVTSTHDLSARCKNVSTSRRVQPRWKLPNQVPPELPPKVRRNRAWCD